MATEAGSPPKIAAGTLYIAPDGDVLMLRRSSTEKNYAGHWSLPGGGAEDGETPEQAADRESTEEIGQAPEGKKKLLSKVETPNGMVFHTFAQPVADKFAPTLNEEHSGYCWTALNDLPQPMHPALAKTLHGAIHGKDAAPDCAKDMSPEDWKGLVTGFLKFISEEAQEPEHAEDFSIEERLARLKERRTGGAEDAGQPMVGDLIEFTDDRFTDKGPASGKIVEAKDGKVTVSFGGDSETFDWSKLAPVADQNKGRSNERRWLIRPEETERTAADAGLAMDRAMARRDRLAFDRASGNRSKDEDGRLRVTESPISKACINPYLGREIMGANPPLRGTLDPDKIYQLLRDPKELEKAAPTFNGVPLLLGHVATSADNHPADDVVGSVGTNVRWAPPYLKASLIVWTAQGIEAIESEEQTELSASYHYDADMTPGTYRGEHYDGRMTNIRGNHVALVPEGRAGPDVVVGDSMEFINMAMQKRTKLSGRATTARGALMAHLRPLLAADAKLDFGPILKDVKARTWSKDKPKIVSGLKPLITGKLAADADVGKVVASVEKLLDTLDPEMDAEDDDPDMDGGDDKPKWSEEDQKAYDDLCEKRSAAGAMDAEAETEEERKDRMEKRATDKARDENMTEEEKKKAEEAKKVAADEEAKKSAADKARDAEMEELKKNSMPKAAVDSAIANAVKAERQRGIDAAAAREAVRPWAGELPMAMDSAASVYKAALEAAGEDLTGVPEAAYAKFAEVVGRAKTAGTAQRSGRTASDAKPNLTSIQDFQKQLAEKTGRAA